MQTMIPQKAAPQPKPPKTVFLADVLNVCDDGSAWLESATSGVKRLIDWDTRTGRVECCPDCPRFAMKRTCRHAEAVVALWRLYQKLSAEYPGFEPREARVLETGCPGMTPDGRTCRARAFRIFFWTRRGLLLLSVCTCCDWRAQ